MNTTCCSNGLALCGATRTAFFAFADTAATRSRSRNADGHGWVGVRFQTVPRAEPSQLILHVTTHDTETAREREAIGLIGVNLLYGAVYQHSEPEALLASLLDNLSRERVEIDMIKFSGPAFANVDNCLMSLRLVEHNFTDSAMFTAAGEVVQPAEVLYQRPILIERGRFRPVNRLTWDLLQKAHDQFCAEPDVAGENPVSLVEISVRDLPSHQGHDERDFLDRVDVLRTLGQTVLISNHGPYYGLVEHLSRYTQKKIGIALGVPSLHQILDDRHYEELAGRTLESVGRLFARNVRMYLYPRWDPVTGTLTTAETVRVRHAIPASLRPRSGERIRRPHSRGQSRVPDDRLRRGPEAHPVGRFVLGPDGPAGSRCGDQTEAAVWLERRLTRGPIVREPV